MKAKLFLSTLVVFAIAIFSITAFAEAPELINYQGRVLDAGGAPVPDGAHTFDFFILDAPAGGVLHWSSIGNAIVTTDGLFTYELGSATPFMASIDGTFLFINNVDLWLEVVVDGVLQTPRTHLISNPFAETAGNISYMSPFSGMRAWNTRPTYHGIWTYGSDGLEQVRMGGYNWGELILNDGDVTNDLTAILSANFSGGGELTLMDDVGTPTIDLHGGQTGNTSVEFPTDAIDADEMYNEPGIVHSFDYNGVFALATADSVVDSIVVDVPTSGYLYVSATGWFSINHTSGGGDKVPRAWVDDSKTFTFDNFAIYSVNSAAPTDIYYSPVAISYVEQVSAGQTIIYLGADAATGTGCRLERTHLTAQFFPTSYGIVDATKMATTGQGSIDGSDVVPAEIYDASLEVIAELEAEREAMKAENARLRLEQERLRETMQTVSDATPSNNQK